MTELHGHPTTYIYMGLTRAGILRPAVVAHAQHLCLSQKRTVDAVQDLLQVSSSPVELLFARRVEVCVFLQ